MNPEREAAFAKFDQKLFLLQLRLEEAQATIKGFLDGLIVATNERDKILDELEQHKEKP